MPIPIDEFDKATDTLSDLVFQFLEEHPDCAYEIHEIAMAVDRWSTSGDEESRMLVVCERILLFHDIVEGLVVRGEVEKKVVDSKARYVFMEQLPK